jgi:hypothetical protein
VTREGHDFESCRQAALRHWASAPGVVPTLHVSRNRCNPNNSLPGNSGQVCFLRRGLCRYTGYLAGGPQPGAGSMLRNSICAVPVGHYLQNRSPRGADELSPALQRLGNSGKNYPSPGGTADFRNRLGRRPRGAADTHLRDTDELKGILNQWGD